MTDSRVATAPPQTPQAQMKALQEHNEAQDLHVRATARTESGDLERVEATITIPPDFQYRIPIKGVRNPDGSWNNDMAKVGLTVDAYDYLNRVVGASFFLPAMVHDENDVVRHNPIHRKDYMYLRMGCVWYTPTGQLVLATEDVEVDFNLVWMDARINTKEAVPVLDADGQLRFDAFGNPMLKLTPADEMKALKTLSQLRSFGTRYAQSVARVRLLKMATGMRSLPTDVLAPYPVKVVGYRDKLTAEERINRVTADTSTFAGKPVDESDPDNRPLTTAEMASVAPELDPEDAIDHATSVQPDTGNVRPFTSDDMASFDAQHG